MPAVAAWAPLPLRVLPPELRPTVLRLRTFASLRVTSDTSRRLPAHLPAPEGSDAPVPAVRGCARAYRPLTADDHRTPILVAVWAAVALALALHLAWGAWSVRRIVRRRASARSIPLADAAVRNRRPARARRARRGCSGATTRRCRSPAALLSRPSCSPPSATSWSADRRRAVLLHELAHVRRRDLLGHTLGRLACAVYWFHPLVWTAAKQLRAESERACDDLALVCGARADRLRRAPARHRDLRTRSRHARGRARDGATQGVRGTHARDPRSGAPPPRARPAADGRRWSAGLRRWRSSLARPRRWRALPSLSRRRAADSRRGTSVAVDAELTRRRHGRIATPPSPTRGTADRPAHALVRPTRDRFAS